MEKSEQWEAWARTVAEAIPEDRLDTRVLRILKASEAKKYALACSGGADSLALLLWARGSPLFSDKGLLVLHYNHHVRGENADEDAAFVEAVAKALGYEYRSAKRPSSARASEAALREARLAFFHSTMGQEGISCLLLGHHEGDIAETLLMRLGRGSGSRGLAAPRPVQAVKQYTHLRPFLSLSKSFILNLLKTHAIPWKEDASNAEGLYLRNRIRHGVLPALEAAFRAHELSKSFARSRKLLEEEDDALEAWLSQVLKQQDFTQGLSSQSLAGLPKALWRRALHAFLRFHHLDNYLSSQGFEKLLDGFYQNKLQPVSLGPHSLLDSRCLILEKNGNHSILILLNEIKKHAPPPALPEPCPITEGLTLPLGSSHSLRVEGFPGTYEERLKIIKAASKDAYQAFIAANTPLYYRFWQVGDRYRPLNAPGSKKLQDLFVDKKVPRALRSQLPVVLDAELQPIWAPGLPVADSHKILPSTQHALRLTYTKNF